MTTENTTTKPQVGDGATVCTGSDRRAYTIIEVNDKGTRATIQRDKAQRTDSNGQSESQTYDYTPDPEGDTLRVSLRKNGRWYRVGDQMDWWNVVGMQGRREYSDPSF